MMSLMMGSYQITAFNALLRTCPWLVAVFQPSVKRRNRSESSNQLICFLHMIELLTEKNIAMAIISLSRTKQKTELSGK